MTDSRQTAWSAALRSCTELQPVPRGTLAGDTLVERPPFSLIRYRPPASLPPPHRRPLLLVYSLVNRPDLLDLAPGRSLAFDLLAAGFPVYQVDWGYPLDADRGLDLEDYVPDFLGRAVDATLVDAGVDTLVLAGVCQGGTLALCHAAVRPRGISHLVTLATPVDFHVEPNPLSQLALTLPPPGRRRDNVPGDLLSAAFAALKPADLMVRRYRALPDLADDPARLEEFLRMEAWMYDCPDQPARMFHRFVADFYQDNRLADGTLVLDGRAVSLHSLKMPVLNILARDDHLVPAPAAKALGRFIPRRRYRECVLPGGHLGVFLSSRNRRTYLDRLVELLETDL